MNSKNKIKSDNLDNEFKKILCKIRQLIPFVNSNAYLMQCRVWLEKLSSASADKNKVLRNLYLEELSKQIEANKLLPPFNEAPPKGGLKKLTNYFNKYGLRYAETSPCDKSDVSPVDDEFMSQSEPSIVVDALSTNISGVQKHDGFNNQDKLKEESFSHPLGNSILITNEKGPASLCSGEPINLAVSNDAARLDANALLSDDSDSWSDVTEANSGPEIELDDNKNAKQVNYTDAIAKHTYTVNSNEKYTDTWSLEKCLKKIKSSQFYSNLNFISQDWKKTIAALELRLSEMIQQNNKLNATVQTLEKELTESKTKNKGQIEEGLRISEDCYNKEVVKLKDVHAQHIIEIKNSYQESINILNQEHELELSQVAGSCDEKIAKMKEEYEELIKSKDIEIKRLSEIIQNQCLRITNDILCLKDKLSNCTCEKKVNLLKKCVSKMDRVFQKSEKEYVRQIEQLKQDLELKENVLQMQLKMQKAELVAQTRTEQKGEFEDILNSLEVKYIKMLEGHEQQIMKSKKQDQEKIKYLTELLVKNRIPFNDNFEYKNC